ncbi:MAG: SDR family oxidoreductase [Burkholderiales bacterium]|nr:SDR family oxidoreductase [Burkholderiales bacterium]
MNARVLVTGASGFVGRAVCVDLAQRGFTVRAVVRELSRATDLPGELVRIADIGADADWSSAFAGVDAVVHLAARVHVMRDDVLHPMAAYRAVNVAGTERLARAAAAQGVKRFVYLSSIKVNGEGTLSGQPYTADDLPAPVDPYGISKREAEEELRRVGRETSLETVIIRPVLVYGPGVKANFLSMMRWLHKGVPLPLGAIHNQRSLVALDNLVDLVMTCLRHPNAPNQTFLVSDGQDLSTTALLLRTAAALGRQARLIPVPMPALQAAARLLGKADVAQRLCGCLQVDISKTRKMLGWVPPVSVDEALKQTAQRFLADLC